MEKKINIWLLIHTNKQNSKLIDFFVTNWRPIREVYIPGKQNRAADLMSHGGLSHNDWRLNPTLIQTLWDRLEVDLFTSQENAQCTLWFSTGSRWLLLPTVAPEFSFTLFPRSP